MRMSFFHDCEFMIAKKYRISVLQKTRKEEYVRCLQNS
jgi:hypothetical protein